MSEASTRNRPHPAIRHAKRVVIAIIGGTVFLFGVLLIFLPGPAFVVIPSGLAILAIEFEWSRRWLSRIRAWVDQGKSRMTRRGKVAVEASSETKRPG